MLRKKLKSEELSQWMACLAGHPASGFSPVELGHDLLGPDDQKDFEQIYKESLN